MIDIKNGISYYMEFKIMDNKTVLEVLQYYLAGDYTGTYTKLQCCRDVIKIYFVFIRLYDRRDIRTECPDYEKYKKIWYLLYGV